MVWAGMILNDRTDLYSFTSANVNAEIYRDEVFDTHGKLFTGAFCNNFLLMDDNARPDHTELVTDYLEDDGFKRIEWPLAYSPDLIPIENVWNAVGLASRQPQAISRSFEALFILNRLCYRKHFWIV